MRGLLREPLYWLILAFPLALALTSLHAGALWTFLAAAVAIIPLAGVVGRSTESLSVWLSPALGGLLNATLGNVAELIIALFALQHGPKLYPLIKASLTGSIIGNVLLVMGVSIVAGGLMYPKQVFNRTVVGVSATMLVLASIGLIMPAVYHHVFRAAAGPHPGAWPEFQSLSVEIAIVLACIYALSLVFMLKTHRELYRPRGEAGTEQGDPEWRPGAALFLMAVATAALAWMSEILVGTVEQAQQALGMNTAFTGVIVISTIGNAAEHSSAVWMALKNKMDAAMQIAVGSSTQVALFIAPVLVFASAWINHPYSLDLHFTLLETVSVFLAVALLAFVCQDGETNWLEGAMMLGVYAIMALAFYHSVG